MMENTDPDSSSSCHDWLVFAYQAKEVSLPERALPAFREALARCEAVDADAIRLEIARTEVDIGDRQAASVTLNEIGEVDSSDGEGLHELGGLWVLAGEPERALQCWARIGGSDDWRVAGLLESLNLCERLRRNEEGAVIGRAMLEMRLPRSARCFAEGLLADFAGDSAAAIKYWQQAFKADAQGGVGIESAYRAAKLLSRCGREEEGLRLLAKAKQVEARSLPVAKVAELTKKRFVLTSNMWERLPEAWFEQRLPVEGATAVTILGHPRSGTSLMARRLAMFGGASWIDESPAFEVEARLLLGRHRVTPGAEGMLEFLAGLSSKEIEGFETSWRERLGRYGTPLKARLVDKNPAMLASLIEIHRLLPHVAWVVMERDPRDIALSCYFQHFGDTRLGVSCLTPEGVIDAVLNTISLWTRVKERLPQNSFIRVRYEELIQQPDREIARVGSGLGWATPFGPSTADGMALGAVDPSINLTPSYRDIHRNIYTTSASRHLQTPGFFKSAPPAWNDLLARLGYE